MENLSERSLAYVLGLLGGLLVVLGGLVAAAFGVADLATGRLFSAAGAASEAVVLFVVGALVLLFAWLGHRRWSDRPLTTGILLVVLAFVSWGVLGLGSNLLALIGGLLALVAGVLFVVEPLRHALPAPTHPAA